MSVGQTHIPEGIHVFPSSHTFDHKQLFVVFVNAIQLKVGFLIFDGSSQLNASVNDKVSAVHHQVELLNASLEVFQVSEADMQPIHLHSRSLLAIKTSKHVSVGQTHIPEGIHVLPGSERLREEKLLFVLVFSFKINDHIILLDFTSHLKRCFLDHIMVVDRKGEIFHAHRESISVSKTNKESTHGYQEVLLIVLVSSH